MVSVQHGKIRIPSNKPVMIFSIMKYKRILTVQKLASFEIDTETDIESCFFYLSDMDHFNSWFPEVINIVGKNKEPIGVGKQYIETVKIPLIGFKKITLTVQNYEKYALFATEGDLPTLLPRMEISLSNIGNGKTRINWVFYSRNSSKLFKLAAPIFKSVMNKRARVAAVTLKNILASHRYSGELEPVS